MEGFFYRKWFLTHPMGYMYAFPRCVYAMTIFNANMIKIMDDVRLKRFTEGPT